MHLSDIKFAEEIQKTTAYQELRTSEYSLVHWAHQVHDDPSIDMNLKWALARAALIGDL